MLASTIYAPETISLHCSWIECKMKILEMVEGLSAKSELLETVEQQEIENVLNERVTQKQIESVRMTRNWYI